MNTQRVSDAINAKNHLINDFYGGWDVTDCSLFEKYHTKCSPKLGCIGDYFGVYTPTMFLPWASHLDGSVIEGMPIPDDGIRAETIEYFSVLSAIEKSDDDLFTIFELGASYAPWSSLAGVLAARRGIKRISITALEASSFLYKSIIPNLVANNVISGHSAFYGCEFEINSVHGAVSAESGSAFFPIVSSFSENGGQATGNDIQKDYVGREVQNELVKCYTFSEIINHKTTIDIVHIDIQGLEFEFIKTNIDLFKKYVKAIFIGTHSRQIESDLLSLLHKSGFLLIRERPCQFQIRYDIDDFTGMTSRDGGQLWHNSLIC